MVLAMEVLAARAMQPAIGSGPVGWAALLATALGTLAIGNLVGGRFFHERFEAERYFLSWALATAAASIVLLSQCYAPSAGIGGTATADCRRVYSRSDAPSRPAGDAGNPDAGDSPRRETPSPGGVGQGAVLAAGSGGGIAGALGAGLLLLPSLGLTRSFLTLAMLLAATAIPAVWTPAALDGRRPAAVYVPVRRWCLAPAAATLPVESLYGQFFFRDTGTGRVLLIDGLHQTALPTNSGPRSTAVWRSVELALMMRPTLGTASVVGLGGGLAPRLLAAHGVACRSVEVDPAVIEIARREFAFAGEVTPGDGRAVLARQDRRYDLIFLDVCTADRLPWHLFTIEAMQLIRRQLPPGGILAIQFVGDDGPWSASLVRTVEAAFGSGPLRDGRPTDSPRSGRPAVALRNGGRAAAIARRRCPTRPAGTLAADRAGRRRRTADRRLLSRRACLGTRCPPVAGHLS